jgi:protoheme IX farnesyltransferase
MCKEDYARVNFKMLPVIEPDGKRTIRQIFWHLALLIPVSIFPYLYGSSGFVYLSGVLILSVLYLISAVPLARKKTNNNAKLLLRSSVLYLPGLLLLIVFDKII